MHFAVNVLYLAAVCSLLCSNIIHKSVFVSIAQFEMPFFYIYTIFTNPSFYRIFAVFLSISGKSELVSSSLFTIL